MRQVLLVAGAALSAEGRLQTALLEPTCVEHVDGQDDDGVTCPRTTPHFNIGARGCGPNKSDPGCTAAKCCEAADCRNADALVDAVPKGPYAVEGAPSTQLCDANYVRRFKKMEHCGSKTNKDCNVANCCTDISATCKTAQETAYKTTPEWKDVIQGTKDMTAVCKAPWATPWALYLGCLEAASYGGDPEYKRMHGDQLTAETNKIGAATNQNKGDVMTKAKENAPKIRLFAIKCAEDAKNSEVGKFVIKELTGNDKKDDGSCASC